MSALGTFESNSQFFHQLPRLHRLDIVYFSIFGRLSTLETYHPHQMHLHVSFSVPIIK